MPPDIEEVVEKKYKTRDGQCFKTIEEAKEYLVELNRPVVYLVVQYASGSLMETVLFTSLDKELSLKKLNEFQKHTDDNMYSHYNYSLISYKLNKEL